MFCRYWRKSKQIAFLIASTFVIHPQTLIFSVIKIVNVSPYWLQIKFFMSLFFYLFTLAINLWRRKFVTTDASLQCLSTSTMNMILSYEDKILIKKSLYLKGYTAKRLTDKFLEKSWTKRGVNNLLKKLWDTGTFDRRPGSGRLGSACTEENVETVNDLVFESRGQAAEPQDCLWDITGDRYSSVVCVPDYL